MKKEKFRLDVETGKEFVFNRFILPVGIFILFCILVFALTNNVHAQKISQLYEASSCNDSSAISFAVYDSLGNTKSFQKTEMIRMKNLAVYMKNKGYWNPTSANITNANAGSVNIAHNLNIFGVGSLGIAATSQGSLVFYNSSNNYYANIICPAISGSYSLQLPLTAGSPNQVLTTDGSGVLSWTNKANAIADSITLVGTKSKLIFEDALSTKWYFTTRDSAISGLNIPVATAQSYAHNQIMSLDITPNGNPSNYGTQGVTWIDLMDIDIVHSSPASNSLRLGMRTNRMDIGGMHFTGTSSSANSQKDLYFVNGGFDAARIDTLGNTHLLKVPTAPTNTLTTDNSTQIATDAFVQAALPGVNVGSYTPSFTSIANVAAIAPSGGMNYLRLGNMVWVWGEFTLSISVTSSATSFRMTLPVNSDLTGISTCSGQATAYYADNTAHLDVIGYNGAVNYAWLRATGIVGTGTYYYQVNFTYRVI